MATTTSLTEIMPQYQSLDSRERGKLRLVVVPAKEAVIQLAFIALRCISRLPGAGRDPYRSRRGDSRGARSQKTFKPSYLRKHGSRLSPGQRERLISKS